jgi:hypothetical protein
MKRPIALLPCRTVVIPWLVIAAETGTAAGRSVFTGFRWLDWNILHIESIAKPAHVPFRAIEIDRENSQITIPENQ